MGGRQVNTVIYICTCEDIDYIICCVGCHKTLSMRGTPSRTWVHSNSWTSLIVALKLLICRLLLCLTIWQG